MFNGDFLIDAQVLFKILFKIHSIYIALLKRSFRDAKRFSHVFTVAGYKLFTSEPGLHGLGWDGGSHRGAGELYYSWESAEPVTYTH